MGEIVGRDAELDALDAWLEMTSSRILLLEGDAGIGKTTLWRAGVAGARERGHRVLAAEAVQAETQLSFTALRDLLEEAFDDVADELSAPQREALGVTLLHEAPRGPPPEQGAIGVSLLAALKALAAQGPVLVAIDDVQWLDSASQASLSYVLRRLGSGPVGVLFARRTTDGAAELPLGLDRLDADRLQVHRLGSLTIGALGHILHERLGVAYPRPTLHRIGESQQATPSSRSSSPAPSASARHPRPRRAAASAGVAARTRRRAPGGPARRDIDVLVSASALSRPTLDRLSAAVGSPPRESIRQALDAGLIEIDDGVVRFAHPLLAAAVYEGASESRRAEIHRHLADIVEDPEERGRHLALGVEEPSEEIASVVEHAAQLAAARGAHAAAAELLEEAHRSPPRRTPGNAPAAPSKAAGTCSPRATRPVQGSSSSTRSESAPPGHARAEALVRLAWLEHHSGDRRVALRSLQALELDETPKDLTLRGDVHLLIALSHCICAGICLLRPSTRARRSRSLSVSATTPNSSAR